MGRKNKKNQTAKNYKRYNEEDGKRAREILFDLSNGLHTTGKRKGKPVGRTNPLTNKPYTNHEIYKETNVPEPTVSRWKRMCSVTADADDGDSDSGGDDGDVEAGDVKEGPVRLVRHCSCQSIETP